MTPSRKLPPLPPVTVPAPPSPPAPPAPPVYHAKSVGIQRDSVERTHHAPYRAENGALTSAFSWGRVILRHGEGSTI